MVATLETEVHPIVGAAIPDRGSGHGAMDVAPEAEVETTVGSAVPGLGSGHGAMDVAPETEVQTTVGSAVLSAAENLLMSRWKQNLPEQRVIPASRKSQVEFATMFLL